MCSSIIKRMLTMIKIVLCDDQIQELDKIKELLAVYKADFFSIDIKTFLSSSELSHDISTIESTDIFLLDIVMPHTSGIELGRLIRTYNKEASIVFLTTSTDYALDAYGLEAIQYLLKPVDKQSLFSAINKAVRLVNKNEQHHLIDTIDEVLPVRINEIKYVEYKDHVLYFCVNNELIRSKFYRLPFTSVIQELFEHKDFISPHRSFLVNMQHINKIHTQSFELDNQQHIPISKNRKTTVRSAYMNFLIKG